MRVVGNLLATNDKHGLLVGFDDAERGLSWDTPVYLWPHEAPYTLVDLIDRDGRILGGPDFGPAVFDISQHTWEMLPKFVATVIAETERQLAADKAERERKIKHSASAQRRNHDRQIRAQKKRGKPKPDQGSLL